MEKSPSNPLSEFEFADIPEENNEVDEILGNGLLQQMEQNLSMVLSQFELSDQVLLKIVQCGLRFSQLSSLSTEDLELFGIEDSELREEMLTEFSALHGQDEHFELVMRQLEGRRKGAEAQEMSVIDLIQNQLSSMNTLIAATIIKVGAARTASSPGIVINKNFNSPQVVIEMLEQLTEHGTQMSELINKLKNKKEMQKREEAYERRNYRRNVGLGVLAVSSMILGFIVAKKVRFGNH